MKANFMKLCALGLGAVTLFGCQEEEDAMLLKSTKTQQVLAENCDVMDFNQYNTGFITAVTSTGGMGPVNIMNNARHPNGSMVSENRAMIFDLENPTGDDTDDLHHPGMGKALIINQLWTSVPNDNQWGGTMMLDFSAIGPITIDKMTVIDIDTYEDASYIRLYDADGNVLKTHNLEPMGNGSVQEAALFTSNVMRMEVMLAGTDGYVGSGAIDDIIFCVMPKAETGCTRTQGYWKNHGDPQNTKKYDSTWDPYVNQMFYTSGMTYMQVLQEPVKGRAYLILAHQYIAAMLNMRAGASMPSDVKAVYDQATAFFLSNSLSYSNKAMKDTISGWATVLDNYNNGKAGPGHCDKE